MVEALMAQNNNRSPYILIDDREKKSGRVLAVLGTLPDELVAAHQDDGLSILWQHDDFVFMARKQVDNDGS